MTLWSHDLARLCDKPKPGYLQYYSAYEYQTWQGRGDLRWGVHFIVVTSWITYSRLVTCVVAYCYPSLPISDFYGK